MRFFKILNVVVLTFGTAWMLHTLWWIFFGGEGMSVFAGFRLLQSAILVCLGWGLGKLDEHWEQYKAENGEA